MEKAIHVSVIIPHFNDLDRLNLCLASLMAQSYPPELLEIVVADNGSPQGPAAIERRIAGRARMVTVEERGAGPARNGGVEASQGEILAFIDSDCQADPNWISEGVRALEAYDFVGGKVSVLVQDWENVTPVEAFEKTFAFDFRHYIRQKGFTGSGNLFCSRAMFQKVGGFRTGVSEDVEWSRRATAQGHRLGYAPRAIVGHPARRTWDELISKWRRVNAEMFGLYCEQRLGRLKWLLRTLALPPSAIAHTPKVLLNQKLRSWPQRVSALPVLYRIRLWRTMNALGLLRSSKG